MGADTGGADSRGRALDHWWRGELDEAEPQLRQLVADDHVGAAALLGRLYCLAARKSSYNTPEPLDDSHPRFWLRQALDRRPDDHESAILLASLLIRQAGFLIDESGTPDEEDFAWAHREDALFDDDGEPIEDWSDYGADPWEIRRWWQEIPRIAGRGRAAARRRSARPPRRRRGGRHLRTALVEPVGTPSVAR
jgi:hypothetical protein